MTNKKLKIGLIGFGVVGEGIYQVLKNTPSLDAEIVKIGIKNSSKERNAPSELFTNDVQSIINNPNINVIVELIDDDIAAYQNLNAQVLAVSVDLPSTLGKFRQLENLNFPLLSDFNKEVSQAYGSYYDEWILGLKGVAKRAAFVIDANGIVRHAEVMESAGDLPDFAKVREALSQLGA